VTEIKFFRTTVTGPVALGTFAKMKEIGYFEGKNGKKLINQRVVNGTAVT